MHHRALGRADYFKFAIAEALARKGYSVRVNGLGAAEFVKLRIKVPLDPGVAANQHGSDLSTPSQIGEMVAKIERQIILAAKVGAFAAFLCAGDPSEMTGSPLSIDGGWLANSQ